MKLSAILATAVFANEGQPRACTDVTSGIQGLNSWSCRACKRIRGNFVASDFGLTGWDSTYSIDIIFPSAVTPRPNQASHPVAQVTNVNDFILRVNFDSAANWNGGLIDFTIEIRYDGTITDAPIVSQAVACGEPAATTNPATTSTAQVNTTTSTTTKTTTTAPTPTTTTTTTPTTTTTTEPTTSGFVCGDLDIAWKTRRNWWKFSSYSSSMSMVQVSKEGGDLDLVNDPYIGFLLFSRKKCGPDFMTAISDGRVSYAINDKIDYYCTKDQFNYYLDDGASSKLALQFRADGITNKGGGKSPHLVKKKQHDTFYLSFNGLDKVDFGSKSRKTCIESVRAGAMADDGGQTDHTQCAAMLG